MSSHSPLSPANASSTRATSALTSPRTTLPPMALPLPLMPFPPTGTKRRAVDDSSADAREHHRRLSHSAIEKRRRERINDKIDQLKYLIPSCCPTAEHTLLPSASMHQPLHKLSVLQAAIDYIQQLHLELVQHAPVILPNHSDKELEMILTHARKQQSTPP